VIPRRHVIRRIVRWGAIGVAPLSIAAASAQTIEVERGRTILVGGVAFGSRTERVDSARTGRARTRLPTSRLRIEWSVPLGALVERSPLVDAQGGVYLVGSRGEVIALARDGSERWRAMTGAAQPGPPVLLSDDTLVFADDSGTAVAVRGGHVRWKAHFGRNDPGRPAPLALDDGGVVLATSHDLAVLDTDGHERARTTLPEETTAPLVSGMRSVIAVSIRGTVWTWTPGAHDPVRIGAFGSPIDGGAALADERTLIAVTAGESHLTAVDLRTGAVSTRAVSLGSLWLGPPAMVEDKAFAMSLTPIGLFAIAFDGAGHELARTVVAPRALPPTADGGPPALVPEAHTPPLIDAAGTLIFATNDGRIGAATHVGGGEGSVELASTPCAPAAGTGGVGASPVVAGLAPLALDVVVAVCGSGTAFAVSGRSASETGPSVGAPSATTGAARSGEHKPP
jgi:outer membrane protein assembly factor BamB